MVVSESNEQATVITLWPNRSATWTETKLVLVLICGTTLAVGIFWAVAGAWAVLPFSGLEAALVAWLLYKVSYATYQRQRITIGADEVLIQCGVHFPRHSWRLPREQTYLAVKQTQHHLDPPVISIYDRRHDVEVGSFLNPEDKDKALKALRNAGLQVRRQVEQAGRASHRP